MPDPLQQVQENATAIDAATQGILTTLAGALNTNAAQAADALKQVKTDIRTALRANQNQIRSGVSNVLDALDTALEGRQQVTQELVDRVLSAAPQGTVNPTQVQAGTFVGDGGLTRTYFNQPAPTPSAPQVVLTQAAQIPHPPIAPQPQGNWTAWCDQFKQQGYAQPAGQPPHNPGDINLGTWPTQLQAQQAAKNCIGAAPVPARWFAQCCNGVLIAWQSTDPVLAVSPQNCGTPTLGPFPTQQAAMAAGIANNLGGCVGQPGPPPPPPPPQPAGCAVPNRPAVACAVGKLPSRIGDVGFCDSIDAIITPFQVVGKLLIDRYAKLVLGTEKVVFDGADEIIKSLKGLPFGIGDALSRVIQDLDCGAQYIMQEVINYSAVALCMVRSVTCDDPEVTLSLVVIRSLITSFKRLRIGTDLALWATVDISIEWDQLEATVDYLIKYSCPYLIPDRGSAMQAYQKNRIAQTQYECWLKMQGYEPGVWSSVLESTRPRPSIQERMTFLHRLRPGVAQGAATYTDQDFSADLTHDGYNQEWWERYDAIRYNVYTIREIRQLLDAGVIGLPETTAAFLDMGFNQEKADILAKMEMVLTTRRREAEVEGYNPALLRTLYGQGIFSRDNVTFYMLKLSYTEEQAKRLCDAEDDRNRAQQNRKWATNAESALGTQLKRGYIMGILGPTDVSGAIRSLGGMPDSATALMRAWDLETQLNLRQAGIGATKKGWESGRLSTVGAIESLVSIGVNTNTATTTVENWSADRGYDQSILGGREVIQSLEDGLISEAEALARLQGMGWAAEKAEFAIYQARQKLAQAAAKAESAALKAAQAAAKAALTKQAQDERTRQASAARAAKAAASLARQAMASQKAALAELNKQYPEGILDKALKNGMISVDAYTLIQSLKGLEPGAIDLRVQEVCGGATANCQQSGGPLDGDLTGGAGNGQAPQ